MRRTALVLIAALLAPPLAPARAQSQPPSGGQAADPVDSEELPVSIVRIRKQLAELPPYDPKHDIQLDYYIEVYGRLPALELFTGIDLGNHGGGVQYGAPTHREFLNLVTPQAFRAPVMDIGSLMFTAANWAAKRAAERRREAERRRIQAEAQRLREPPR